MDNKETILDEVVSPLMVRVLAICMEHGIPMFATFQYSDSEFCTSMDARSPDAHPVFQHYSAIRQCIEDRGVNIDKYMAWNAREASKTGHTSVWLSHAGVPTTPAEESTP